MDNILIIIPNINDGLTLSDYNVFIQTRIRGALNKIELTETDTELTTDDQTAYIWTLTTQDTKRYGILEFEV
ncbi:MAG: hypothetical protein WCQ87_07620, partial [Parabacteroides sp.]